MGTDASHKATRARSWLMTEMEAQKQKNKMESCQCRETQRCAFGEQRTKKKKKNQTFTKDQRCVQSIMLSSQWYQETRKSGVSWMCFNISLILSLAINETSHDSAVRARLCVSVRVCCSDDISVPERLRYCHVVSEQLRRECSSRLQALLLSRRTEQGVKRWLTFFFFFFFANSK